MFTGHGGWWARLPERRAGDVHRADSESGESERCYVPGAAGEERDGRVRVSGGRVQEGARGEVTDLSPSDSIWSTKINGWESWVWICLLLLCILCVHTVCFVFQSKLKNELSSLKKAVESSELQCLELQVRWHAEDFLHGLIRSGENCIFIFFR